MQIIQLDASKWKTVLDFCRAILSAIGAPERHGKSLDAFIDSMVWGGINAVEPPYTVRISGTAMLPRGRLRVYPIGQTSSREGLA